MNPGARPYPFTSDFVVVCQSLCFWEIPFHSIERNHFQHLKHSTNMSGYQNEEQRKAEMNKPRLIVKGNFLISRGDCSLFLHFLEPSCARRRCRWFFGSPYFFLFIPCWIFFRYLYLISFSFVKTNNSYRSPRNQSCRFWVSKTSNPYRASTRRSFAEFDCLIYLLMSNIL